MQCPACSNRLVEKTVSDITVDVCERGCGGIWFDNFELDKLEEPHDSQGESLLEVERNPDVRVDHEAKRPCPRCESMVMMQHYWSVNREVEVDECPGCGGHWLDDGEIGRIRTMFDSEEERQRATQEHFAELFGDQLQAARAESEATRQRSRRIANMFKFICPSYYIPGNQQGGAF